MAISKPRDSTRRAVLARSGNQCAYSGCSAPIYDQSGMVGQLAHIKGNRPGSARHDPSQDVEERQGEANLIAMCKPHGSDVIDGPNAETNYPVPALRRMKAEHEARIEGLADRSWIRPPNSIVGGNLGNTPVHFWVDRQGRDRIYSDDQLAMLSELLKLSIDISNLNTTMQALHTLDEPVVKSLLQQSYAKVGGDADNLYAHLVQRMAVAPDVTFGEFLHFVVDGNNATPVIDAGSKRRQDIIEGRLPSFWRTKT